MSDKRPTLSWLKDVRRIEPLGPPLFPYSLLSNSKQSGGVCIDPAAGLEHVLRPFCFVILSDNVAINLRVYSLLYVIDTSLYDAL